MEFEYVKILTSKEEADYVKSIHSNKSKSTLPLAQNNSKLLFEKYELLEQRQIEKYKDDLKAFNDKVNLWNTKTCKCGKPLNYVQDFNFWGCSNYMNKEVNHITFKANSTEEFDSIYKNVKVRISRNWCSDILKECKLHGKLNSKTLVEFYLKNGYEDLRAKYGYKTTIETISSFVYANENSKREENEIKEFLSPYFTKVIYQTYIKYKTIGEKPKVKIVDLIASDAQNVYLIEIKRHNIYIDMFQLETYFNLLKYLMNEIGDSRKLSKLFIVNEKYVSEYKDVKCILFKNLQKLGTLSEIKYEFERNKV